MKAKRETRDLHRFEDDEGGFAFNPGGGGVGPSLTMWGFLTPETALAFEQVLLPSCIASALEGGRSFTLNAPALKCQAREGQDCMRKLLLGLKEAEVEVLTVWADSALLKMQLIRIAREATAMSILRFTQRG